MKQDRRSAISGADGREEPWWDTDRTSTRAAGTGLLALIAALAIVAAALWLLGGPPRVPTAPPDLAALRRFPDFLGSSPGPAEFLPALPWALACGWLLWSWLTLSVLLQVGVAALELLTRGAAWVRALRPLVDLATATIARRAVTGATASYLLVRVLAATSQVAHAAPSPDQAQTLVLADPADPHAPGATRADRGLAAPGTIDYVIQPGDSLWRIAERFYGDGELYPRLLAANQGRLQANGVPFHGVLYPGEVLLVPTAGLAEPGGSREHVVRPGDTLRAIAAAELGDESRWPELEVAGVPVRQALADPDLIHPGLRVAVPGLPAVAAPLAPLALPDAAIEARDGAAATIAVTVAPDGTPLTVTAVTQGAHGTVALAPGGAIVYTPTRGYTGPDSFTFTASDPQGRTATATVRVTVTAAPARPRPAAAGLAAGAALAGRVASPVAAPASPVATGAAIATPSPAVAPTPTPILTAPRATPVPSGQPAARDGGEAADLPGVAVGAGVAGLALVACGAVLLRRRRRGIAGREVVRRLRGAPKPAWQVAPEDYPTDFARAELTHAFQHRLAGGEPEPAAVLATHAAASLREAGLADSVVLLAAHERQSGIVTVRTTPAERRRVMTLAAELGGRLGGRGRGERQGNDVELRLAGPTARGLLGPPVGPQPTMIALAALPNGARVLGNFDALGHILVAGAAGEGADMVLTTLVAELAARRAPDELQLYALAPRRALPSDLLAMPHWDGARVDPADLGAVAELLARLQRALDARRRAARAPADPDAPPVGWPELVLVIGELAGLDDRGLTTLAQIGRDGPEHGLRLVAATTRPADLRDDLLAHFATRLVLRLAADAQSVRLVGSPDATALGGGGRLLLRLAGESPRPFAGVEASALRGLRLGTEDLAALAQGMIVHYGSLPAGATTAAPADDEAVAAPVAAAAPLGDDVEGGERSAIAPSVAADRVAPRTGQDERSVAGERDAGASVPARVAPQGEHAGNNGHEPLAAVAADAAEERAEGSCLVSGGTWWDDGEDQAVETEPAEHGEEGEPAAPPEPLLSPAATVAGGEHANIGSVGPDSVSSGSVAAAVVPAEPPLPEPPPTSTSGRNGGVRHRNGGASLAAGSATHRQNGHAQGTAVPAPRHPDARALEGVGHARGVGDDAGDGVVDSPPQQDSAAPVATRATVLGRAPIRGDAPPVGAAEARRAVVGPGAALADDTCSPDSSDTAAADVPVLAPAETGVLEIACFGPQPQLSHNGRRIILSRPKGLELLAFCAVHPPGPLDREMVLQLVWPDKSADDEDEGNDGGGEDEEAKRKRLRTTMWRLNRDLEEHGVALPRPPLRAERDGTITLDTALIRSDVHRFLARCDLATDRRKPPPPLDGAGGAVAACREAHALLAAGGAGERRLLGGSGYEWLDAYWRGTRIEDNLRRRLRQAFERVGERCLAEGCYETAAQLLATLFEEDYTDQEIARKLLLAYGQLGDRVSVLHVDRMLRQALKRTLFDGLTARERIGISEDAYAPARETRLLVERLLNELAGKDARNVEEYVHGPVIE